jgi:hypothetical protein
MESHPNLLEKLRRWLSGLQPAERARRRERSAGRVVASREGPGNVSPQPRVAQPGPAADDQRPVQRPAPPSVPEPAAPMVAARNNPDAVAQAPAPIAPVSAPGALPAPAAAPALATANPAPAKTMRSLEEVRADLARLRESARERHAQLQVRRVASFPTTDFMEMAKPHPPHEPHETNAPHEPAPARTAAEEPDTAFAATAFLDFGTGKARPR